MKKSVLLIVAGLFLGMGSLLAQATMVEVINEFNNAVASMKDQSYETALTQFGTCLTYCDEAGAEADDMKRQAQEQIVGTYFMQAQTLLKRKQYDKAVLPLENTVATSAEYGAKPELAQKASKYLPPLYTRQGNVLLKQGNLEESMTSFDKALALRPSLYKAHQGKGLVFKEQGEIDSMLEEFVVAKEKALAKEDMDVVNDINKVIDGYYNPFILEEVDNIDPEEADYTYLYEACDNALAANPANGLAAWKAAAAKNKEVLYDEAIAYIEPVVENVDDSMLSSALYYELGIAYQNTVRYKEACEAYNNVTEDPFFTKAEKKMMTTPDCN